jgi:hypothetical protein
MVELAAKALCRFEAAAWRRSVRLCQRVASAVGEGAMAMQFVEEYLKEM